MRPSRASPPVRLPLATVNKPFQAPPVVSTGNSGKFHILRRLDAAAEISDTQMSIIPGGRGAGGIVRGAAISGECGDLWRPLYIWKASFQEC